MENETIETLITDVLKRGYLMSLATIDNGGVWACDVIYIYDGKFNLYWMSDPSARHSQALCVTPHIAGTITVSAPQEDNLGIQFEGIAEKIEGPRYDLAVLHLTKRRKPVPKESDDILGGDSWFMVRPKKIELICERLFGFNKQTFEL